MAELADLESCVAPVNDVAEALRDPQVIHRGMVAEIEGRPVGRGPAVKAEDRGSARPAPDLGQLTEEVLLERGFAAAGISRLRQQSDLKEHVRVRGAR